MNASDIKTFLKIEIGSIMKVIPLKAGTLDEGEKIAV